MEVDLTAEQRSLLADNNRDPASTHRGRRSRGSNGGSSVFPRPSDLSYRISEGPHGDTNRKQARCQRDLHCCNQGVWSSRDRSTFYIQLIVLLFKVEYFYFSPCQGLFCTCTVMKFATGVLLFIFMINVFSDIVNVWFKAFSWSCSVRMN